MSDDLRLLTIALEDMADDARPAGRAALQDAALSGKTDWRQRWSGISGMPALAAAVTYDTRLIASGAEAELGPDKDRPQGPLGNIVEFGTSTQGPKRPVTEPVLKAMADRLESSMTQIGDL